MSSSLQLSDDYKRRLDSSHTSIKLEGLLILYKKLQRYKAHDPTSSKVIDSTQHDLQTQLILLMSGKYGNLIANLSMEIGLKLVVEGCWNWGDMANRILQVIEGRDAKILESGVNYLFKLLNLLITGNNTNFSNFSNPLIKLINNNSQKDSYWQSKLIFIKFKEFFNNSEGELIDKFNIMESYLDLILLNGDKFEYFEFLINLINKSKSKKFAELVTVYTLNLIQRMDSENCRSVDYLSYLINWYIKNKKEGASDSVFSNSFSNQLNSIIPLHLMNLTCKNHYNQKPVTEELNLLLDWFKLSGVEYPNETCLMLSYLLFTSNTTQDRSLIFDLLEFGSWFDNIQFNILPTLLLPLLAIVDQSILKPLQLRTKALLNKLIERISSNTKASSKLKELTLDQIKLELENSKNSHNFIINGPLSQVFYSVQCLQEDQLDASEFANLNPDLTIIITTAFTTHSNGDIQLKALELYLQCLAQNTNHLLPSISLFVYLLNSKSTAKSTPYLLYQCFPALVSTSDPFVLTKILKLTEKVISMKVGFQTNSLTSAVGIRMMFALYTNNNKIWPTLRFIITNWLKVRKANANRLDSAPSSPTELELAALTTFRELCTLKGGEYGPDLFPLLSSLVQFVPLHPLSLSYVLSCINSIVADDAVEVLAVWKVVISPLLDQFENFSDLHPLLQLEICKFYTQLIRKREETESYITLVDELIHERLRPVLFPLENQKISFWVRNEALGALNQFESDKIQTIMFTTPNDLLKSICETGSSQPNWIPLLGRLVAEEVEGMSRSTFKGQTGIADVSTGSAGAERSKKVKESLDTIAESFNSTGLINHPPGLKSAIYLSNLQLFFRTPIEKMKANRDRLLKVAISEITFGDDLQFRLTHFECWTQFFLVATVDSEGLLDVNKVEDTPLDLEWTQNTINSLTETINSSSIPSHVANASAALGALCISLKQSGRDDMADAFGTRILKTLLQKFETLTSNFIESHTDIFYTISTSVSQLITCVPKDFALCQSVIDLLAKGMVSDNNVPGEWIGYSCGRGLGRVFQSIASNLIGGQTAEGGDEFNTILTLLNQILILFEQSFRYLDAKDVSFLMESGIRLGYNEVSMSKFSLARLYQIELNMQVLSPSEILNSLVVQLESFLDPNAGLLQSLELVHKLTALTVCLPYFAPCLQLLTNDKNHETQLETQLINLFTKVIQFIEAPQWSQLRGSCNKAFGTFLHIRVSLKGGANSLSKYYSLMNWYLDQLDSNIAKNLSSHQRLANLMGLSSLLGVDPLNYSKIQPFCTSNQSSFNNVKRALSVLQNYTGLSNPQFLGDLKTCRSVVNMTSQLIHSSNLEPRDDTLYRRLLITVNSNLQISGSNLEPRDYSRFSLATSYLRSIYESLSQFGGAKEYFEVNLMLIETLDSLSLPLPPVNWFPILSSMAPLCKDNNRVILLKFVVNNFLKSNSIMEFFLNELDQLQISLPNHNKESLDLLLGMEGFGTVLKLVGFGALEDRSNLRGGWGAILKLVTVSLRRLESILIKTCQMMIRKPKLYDALTTLLATLSNCLQAGISNDVNKSELERVLESWSKFFKESYFNLDIAIIDSVYDPLLTLIVGLASYDRVTIDDMISSLGSKSNSQTHIGPILYHQLLINNREGIKSTLKVFSYCLEEGVTTVSLIEWLLKCLAMNLEFQTVISLLNLIILATSNAQDKVTIVARGITYLIGIFQRKLVKNPQSDASNSIVSHVEFTKLTTILFQIRVEFNKYDLKMVVNRLKILEDSLTSSNEDDDSTLLILNIWQKVLNF